MAAEDGTGSRFGRKLWIVVVAVLTALLPLVVIAAASLDAGFSPGKLTRDPTSIAGMHPLSGALSSAGVLLWWTSAVIWIGSASLLRRARRPTSYRFALSSGLLSGYLALDDLFQFHDIIGPEYIGFSENAVYVVLASAVAAYVAVFRRQIFRRDGILLILSFGLLAVSVAVDTVFEQTLMTLGRWLVFFEDGAKWLGITSWLAFCIVRCRAEVSTATGSFSRSTPASR